MKKYILVLIIALFSGLCFGYGCTNGTVSVKNFDEISLSVGETYVLNYSSEEGKIAVTQENDNLYLSIIGNSISVYAAKSGTSSIEVELNNVIYKYPFVIADTTASIANNGFVIFTKDTYKLVDQITTPIKTDVQLKFAGQPVEGTISYAIDDTSVATVSQDGIITSVGVGQTVLRITATYNGETISKTCSISVFPNADIVFDKNTVNLFLSGESEYNTVCDFYKGNSNIPETSADELIWKSSDVDVATVDSNGKVTANSVGQTIVYANYNGYEAGFTVNVYNELIEVSSVNDLKNVTDGNYYKFTRDIEWYFTDYYRVGEQGNKSDYLIEELGALIDGNGYALNMGYTDELIFSDNWIGHSYNVNFIKTIKSNGVLRNIKINYLANPQNNLYTTSTFAFGENYGLIEDLIYHITLSTIQTWYTSFYVSPGQYVDLLCAGGNGNVRNSIITVDGNAWPLNSEANKDQCRLLEGANRLNNIIVVSNFYLETRANGSNIVKIPSGKDLDKSGFSLVDFDLDGKESNWGAGNNGLPLLKADCATETVEVYSAQDILDNSRRKVNYELKSDITIELDQSEGGKVYAIKTLYGLFNGNGHKVTVVYTGNVPSSASHFINFVNTISTNGLIKNTKFVFEGNTQPNGYEGPKNISYISYLCENNEGGVKDCTVLLNVTFDDTWYQHARILGNSGTGYFERIIISGATGRSDCDSQSIAVGSVKNVLFYGVGANKMTSNPVNNVYCLSDLSSYQQSGFSVFDFDIDEEDSIWTLDSLGVPVFKRPKYEIVTVNSQEEFESLLETYDTNLKDIELNTDLVFDFEQGAETTKYVIETLKSKLNGNGHTVTINFTGTMTVNGAHYYNFINTVSEDGELTGLKVVFTGTVTRFIDAYNISPMTYLTKTNSGYIHDVVIDTTNVAIYWAWVMGTRYVANDGNGTVNNVIVIDPKNSDSKDNGEGYWYIASGSVTNVLYTGVASGRISSDEGKNIISVPTGGDTSSFNTSSFDSEIWDLSSAVPKLKKNVVTVDVYTVEELQIAAQQSNNISLMADLTVDLAQGSDTTKYVIKALNSKLNGNGHSVTINFTGIMATTNNPHYYNFINTISGEGELLNLKVVFTGLVSRVSTAYNASPMSYLTKTNNGSIHDVVVDTTSCGIYWAWIIGMSYVSNDGNGTVNNVIVIDPANYDSKNNGEGTWKIASGTVTNVLYTGIASGRISSDAQNNVLSIPTGGDISSFDTSSFSTDIWDLSGNVPTLKQIQD